MQKHHDPLVAAMVKSLAAGHREWFEERAGILEYDAGYVRSQAEVLALLMTLHRYPEALIHVVVLKVDVDEEVRWVLTSGLERLQFELSKDAVTQVSEATLADVLLHQFGGVAWLSKG